MRFRLGVASFVLIASTALIVATGCPSNPGSIAKPRTSAYERVMSTGVIRCGYVTYPPGCIKDANTGKLNGIFVDAIQKASENMGLKVEWAEEVGWGSMIEGLKSDRYDLVCSPVWANASRGKQAAFSVPLFFSGIGIYVRANDTRFDGSPERINSPTIRVATVDGEMSDIIARSDFALASRVSHPQLSDVGQLLLDVADGKADATFVEPYIAQLFEKSHPGALKNIVAAHPIRVFPNTMMLRIDEPELRSMLDTALAELLNSGFVDESLRRYSPRSGAFYPVARPYGYETAQSETPK